MSQDQRDAGAATVEEAAAAEADAERLLADGDSEEAAVAAGEAARLWTEAGDHARAVWCDVLVASAAADAGRDQEAVTRLRGARDAFDRHGLEHPLAVVDLELGLLLADLGRDAEARPHLAAARDRLTELGDERSAEEAAAALEVVVGG